VILFSQNKKKRGNVSNYMKEALSALFIRSPQGIEIKCHRLNYVNYNCGQVNCITFLYKYKRTRSQNRKRNSVCERAEENSRSFDL